MRNAKIHEYTGTEIISLTEAKQYLRVDFADDDTYITELIKIARVQILKDTAQVIVKQTITENRNNWGSLIFGPNIYGTDLVVNLSYVGTFDKTIHTLEIKYYDTANVLQTLLLGTDYRIIQHQGLLKIQFINTFNTFDRLDAISIKYEIAPENEDTIRPLKIAAYMLIQHFYDNRSAVSFLKVDEMPLGYKNIINQYKNYIWQ
tara:strand:- start:2694 stop:3305 length:612 start_codon:yes stop_codon:yes gene_type:complete